MEKKFQWSVKKTIQTDPEIKERLNALTDIRFTPAGITEKYIPTCAKLTIGRKFYILRAKSLGWMEMHLNSVLKAYNMNGTSDMYLPIVKHVHNTGWYDIDVEIICQDENPYNVIKAEFLALQSCKGASNCLNPSFEPYMPKYNAKTGMYGWLTVNQFLNYKKLVKSYE